MNKCTTYRLARVVNIALTTTTVVLREKKEVSSILEISGCRIFESYTCYDLFCI